MATIDNGAKITFEEQFMHQAQQERSKLENSPAIKHIDPRGKTHNMATIGSLELVEAKGRNPLKIYADYNLDNRMMTKHRYTLSVLLDEKQDVNELIKDPTSDLMQNLLKAKSRVTDRICCSAAGGDVIVGRPDRAGNLVSATNDGVVTVDATAGLTAAKIGEITENFINADIDMEDISKTTLLFTGKENTALMNEEKFINNDYIGSRPVESGVQKNVSGFNVVLFAGSSAGVGTKANPILEETATERTCLALAPNSIALSMELAKFDVEPSPQHVNSKVLTIDLWINAMRIDGKRVQKIKTTI